jgi:hypothetical protein
VTIDLGENPLISNDHLTKRMHRTAARKMRGLDVLYGPQGVGKSTYIREFLRDYVKNGGHGVVVKSATTMSEIREALSIPDKGKLDDFLPPGSLIIVDQVENCDLNDSTDRFFRMLAIESRQQNRFHAIACTSDPLQARRLMKLNGGDKIQYLSLSEDLKWSRSQVDLFISKKFSHLSDRELEELQKLAYPAACPGFLVEVHNAFGDTGFPVDSEVKMKYLRGRSKYFQDQWKEFKLVDENPYI